MEFVEILGICSYVCLILAVLTGIFRRKIKFKYHFLFAILAISFSTLQVIVISLR